MKEHGELVAVCDVSREAREKASADLGCETLTEVDEFLAQQLDLVAVCTPNYLHAEHTVAALRAGKDVICEKPMSLSVEDCERMIAVSRETTKRIFVVKQNRFNPPVQRLKQLIDDGSLGRIYSFQLNCFWNRNENYFAESDWRGKDEKDGGILFTQFSHFVDLLSWLFGKATDVNTIGEKFRNSSVPEFDDTVVSVMKFSNGVIGSCNFTINSHEKNMEGSITIFAENGTIKIGGKYLNTLEYQDIKNLVITDLEESKPANNYGDYEGSMSNHDLFYNNVMDVLNGNGELLVEMEDGLRTVELICRISSVTQQ